MCSLYKRTDAERPACAQNISCKHKWRDVYEFGKVSAPMSAKPRASATRREREPVVTAQSFNPSYLNDSFLI
jgi:hypothetical protein